MKLARYACNELSKAGRAWIVEIKVRADLLCPPALVRAGRAGGPNAFSEPFPSTDNGVWLEPFQRGDFRFWECLLNGNRVGNKPTLGFFDGQPEQHPRRAGGQLRQHAVEFGQKLVARRFVGVYDDEHHCVWRAPGITAQFGGQLMQQLSLVPIRRGQWIGWQFPFALMRVDSKVLVFNQLEAALQHFPNGGHIRGPFNEHFKPRHSPLTPK